MTWNLIQRSYLHYDVYFVSPDHTSVELDGADDQWTRDEYRGRGEGQGVHRHPDRGRSLCFLCLLMFNVALTSEVISTVPTCSSGTLTNVLPHRNTMSQTPYPVTVYRHRANLLLYYPLMWNVTLDYTTTHFNVLGQTRSVNASLTFQTHHQSQMCHTKLHVMFRDHGWLTW